MSIRNCKSIQIRAERLAVKLLKAHSSSGTGSRMFTIKGVDPNEVKKIYTYLCHYKDLHKLKQLLRILPKSPLCRTNKTAGYYLNINSVFNEEKIYELSIDEALAIIGWACRLL